MFCAVLLILLFVSGIARAQAKPETPKSPEAWGALRARVVEMCDGRNELKVVGELKLLAEHDDKDSKIQHCLGNGLVAFAAVTQDAETRRATRRQARSAFLRAKELGDTSLYVQIMINGISADGSDAKFSDRKEVDESMQAGEAAFAKQEYDEALRHYARALELDPNNYWASLFIGDVYYAKREMDTAGEWFSRTAAMNPDLETAFRYWGDALLSQGKLDEARNRYIDAVIAQPYGPQAWSGMQKWSKRTGVALTHPRIESPNSMKVEKEQTNITIDASTLDAKDGRQHWMMYEIVRAGWKGETFKKEFPNEKAYRHTLREEAEALRTVAEIASEDVKKKKIKQIDVSIGNLLKLHEAGLIEAYVLFARHDEGIEKDYEAYRATKREKLRRYLEEYVAPKPK